MTLLKGFVVFLFVCSVVSASVTITYPIYANFDSRNATYVSQFVGDKTILTGKMLGKVAPGQTLVLVFSRETGSNWLWDRFQTSTGWNEHIRIGDEITLIINIPKDAQGMYQLNITGTGSYEPGIVKTPEVLPITLEVTPAVYEYVFEQKYDLYVDYPNSVFFKVKSNSLAADVLEFSIADFPAKWVKKIQAKVEPLQERKLFFSINPMEEKSYRVKFTAMRESGITDIVDGTLDVHPATLKTKLKSLSEGFSIVPIILQPFYSLLSLLGLI
jgi:hypothetical protein